MRLFFGKYRIVFLIACFIGLCYSLPNIYYYLSQSSKERYIPLSFSELLYGAQVREVLEGNIFVGDPQFFEHKREFLPIFPLVTIFVLAAGAQGVGIINMFLFADFIFPSVLFLLMYYFVKKMVDSRSYALVTSAGCMVLYSILGKLISLSLPQFIESVRNIFLLTVAQPLPFYRTPNPQISFIFLIIALIYLYKTVSHPSPQRVFLLFLSGSLLWSVYFYHATFFFFTLSSCILIQLLKREWKNAIFLGISFVGIATIGMGYSYLSNLAAYQSIKVHGGVFYARYFDVLFFIRYAVILLPIYFLRKRLSTQSFNLLVSMIVSAILCMNFQLFSGWTIQPAHWPQTTLEPILFMSIAICSFYIFKKIWNKNILHICLLLIFAYGFLYQIRFIQTHEYVWSIPEDFRNVLKWVNEHAPPDSVITSLNVNDLNYLPVLTHANIFVPVEQYHYASTSEIWERIRTNYSVYGFKDLPERIDYGIYFELAYNVNRYKHAALSEYELPIQKAILVCFPSRCSELYALPYSVINEQNALYEKGLFSSRQYKLDYALYGPYEKKLGAQIPAGNLVFHSGDYELYELNSHAQPQASISGL